MYLCTCSYVQHMVILQAPTGFSLGGGGGGGKGEKKKEKEGWRREEREEKREF